MFDALLCLSLKGGNLLGLSSLHACRSLSTGLQHTGEGGFFSKTRRFFSLRSVIYILINLEFRGLHARGCRGDFWEAQVAVKREGKHLLELLSYQKISYAVGKCCASVEQRQFQVINVLPLPALGKSRTLAGDLYNFMSKLKATVERGWFIRESSESACRSWVWSQGCWLVADEV